MLQIDFVCLILPLFCIAVMLVGALIFGLGIDLVKEALWDTRYRVSRCVLTNYSGACFCINAFLFNRSEYITIISIMICMTAWDFVIGVLFGIVVSCQHCPRIPKGLES
jgi:SulP family sulfate permease